MMFIVYKYMSVPKTIQNRSYKPSKLKKWKATSLTWSKECGFDNYGFTHFISGALINNQCPAIFLTVNLANLMISVNDYL